MPTYSYACTDCDNKFDIVQAFTDDALTECPKCDGRLRKLFGRVGVVFKGSGFYRTDSRESAKSSTNGAAKSPESPSSSEKKPDSTSSSTSSSSEKGSSAGSSSSSSSSAPAAAAASS